MSWTISAKYKDPDYNNVSLLLHGNGTNGSTTITDNSPSPKTVTAVGNAQISTAQSKFGGSSLFVNTSRFAINDDSAFGFGTGDFTFETWILNSSWTGDRAITDFRPSTGAMGTFFAASGKLAFWTGSSLIGGSGTTLELNTWHHVALTRSGTTLRAFRDGVLDFTGTLSLSFTASRPLGIGAAIDGSSGNTGAYIDDLRITKGIARYTSNFTPPAAPFLDI